MTKHEKIELETRDGQEMTPAQFQELLRVLAGLLIESIEELPKEDREENKGHSLY